MAMYMFMARYSREAMQTIMETGSNREDAARVAIEAAGGKLLGFYGMIGQEYQVAIVCEVPGVSEFIGAIAPAIMGGTIESWKSIPLYTADEMVKASAIAKKVAGQYKPPAG